jgi:hypothetical protein
MVGTLSAARAQNIDVFFEEGVKPAFPKTLESVHFTVRYTDSDSEASHNINPASIEPLLPELDSFYETYLAVFGKISPTPPLRLLIDVYNFQLDVRFEYALGFTTPNSVSINIAPSTLANPCLARHTLAHELFHRVQMAFGLVRGDVDHTREGFWVEGMAEWAAINVIATEDQFAEAAKAVFQAPYVGVLERSYDAALFWIHLDTKYRELRRKRKTGDLILDLLSQLDTSNGYVADFLPETLASVYKGERRKGKGLQVRGRAPAPEFLALQRWHIDNLFLALGARSEKIGYDAFSASPSCPTPASPGLTPEGDAFIDSDTKGYAHAGDARYGGAVYYRLRLGPKVRRVKYEVKAEGPVVVTALTLGGNRLDTRDTTARKHKGTVRIKPGKVDALFIVVGGAGDPSARAPYRLEINGGSGTEIDGAWDFEDDFSGLPNGNILQVTTEGDKVIGTFDHVNFNIHWRLEGTFAANTWMGTFTLQGEGVVSTGGFSLTYQAAGPDGREQLDGYFAFDSGGQTQYHFSRPRQ